MKKLSKIKKAILMLTMLLSLTVAFANDGTSNPVGDFLGKFWGEECSNTNAGTKCCKYRFWIETSCQYVY
jgi:hypothetical protein